MELNKTNEGYNQNIISLARNLLPKLKVTESRHVLLNTIWITLAFALLLAMFLRPAF
ncbi:MAG: hypothetical protein ACXVPN_00265 [Bacteroidia bacterium]